MVEKRLQRYVYYLIYARFYLKICDFFYSLHMHHALCHPKVHAHTPELHFVHPLRVVLVGGARVLRQYLHQCTAGFFGKVFPCFPNHRQSIVFRRLRKPVSGFGVGIGVCQIGLDIVYRCAVHEVSPRHHKHQPLPLRLFHAQQTHAAQPQRVRTKRRPSGKHPHPLVPSQPRWSHRRRPTQRGGYRLRRSILGESPY